MAAVGTVALLFVLLVGGWLLGTHVRTTGTNSVAPRYPIPGIGPGERLCARQLVLPASTNAIKLAITGSTAPTPVTMRLSVGGRTQTSHAVAAPGIYGAVFHFSALGHEARAAACVSTNGGTVSSEAGMPLGGTGEGTVDIDGKPQGRITVSYLHYPSSNLLSNLAAGARRAALFRAGFVGAWTYWLLALAVLGCWIAGLRVMLRSVA